jgi:hypothetical protein
MRGERHALRTGEYLVSRACRRLPARIREERYQEWLAELPVILHDRGAGPAPLRVVRMLAFAADTLRGTTLAPDAYHGAHRGAHQGGAAKTIRWLADGLLLLGGLLGALLVLLAYEGYIVYQLIDRRELDLQRDARAGPPSLLRRQPHPAVGHHHYQLVRHG